MVIFTDPVQYSDEASRGVTLADEMTAARSEATGLDRATAGEKAQRFLEYGRPGLVDRRTTDAGGRRFPEVVAGYVLHLKLRYPITLLLLVPEGE